MSNSMSTSQHMLAAPTKLLSRLTPVANKRFSGDFSADVKRLQRPYYRLSEADYEAVKQLSGTSDVLLLDGKTQVSFGDADGGYALMPLYRPI